MKALSIKDLFSFGWGRFLEAPWRVVGVTAAAIVISIVSSYIVGELTQGAGTLTAIVLGAADFVVQTFIGVGFIAVALKAHDAIASLEVQDLWVPQYFWQYLFATILVGIIVLIGFVLLIIPGLVAMVMLMFTPYFVVDKDMGAIEAMKQSRELTKGHRWKLFFLIILVALLNLLGSLLFLVGLIVTIPISILIIAHAYRTLEGGAHTAPEEVAAEPESNIA